MLHEKFKHKNIVLASGSPRRQELLKGLDIPFEIKLKSVDEVYPNSLKAQEITNYLSNLKAEAIFSELSDHDILITADTIVWHENKALEKPNDAVHAVEMLKKMSGNTHEVITSVCIKSKEKQLSFFDTTTVYVKNLTENEINYYVTTYKPFDKAGAYGIQEWFGFTAVTKIEGSYFNVMGLPIQKLYEELVKF